MRHEAAAGHAAEGWARVKGRPGVALATSGPGAVNLLTAVADAWMDSVPVVFICGQVATHLAGTMAFQETDVAGMAIPVVKHSSAAGRGEDLGAAFDAAFALAASGRPGAVLAGGGVIAAGAQDQVRAFTRAADVPYVTTLHGLECGGGSGWLGMAGVYGTRVGNWALHQADCIVAVGARFDDRLTGSLDGFA